jgi:hypothetical protein
LPFIGPSMTPVAVSAVDRKARHEGGGLPVPLRNLADQPFAARRTSAQANHVGRRAGLVDEDQALRIEFGLVLGPFGTRHCNVRPILLGRAQAFFEADAVAVEEPPDRADPGLAPMLVQQSLLNFLQRQIGLPSHQLKQPFLVTLERRPALPLVRSGLETAGLPPAFRPADRRARQ